MTLCIDTVRGPSLSPPPVNYFFRCVRGDRVAKITAAKPLTSDGVFNERISLYAQVRRPGRYFTVDADADPLETTLILVAVNPQPSTASRNVVVSETPFDIGHHLIAIVDSASTERSRVVTLNLEPDIVATVTVSIKTIGESHLHPYTGPEPRRNAMRATTPHAQDADEAVAAEAIQRLRLENRPHENRPHENRPHNLVIPHPSSASDAPADPASALPSIPHTPTTPKSSVASASSDTVALHRHLSTELSHTSDLPTLHAHIRNLEEEVVVAKRERADAERKVSAHIAHACRIRETYTKLAGWYNNLRQEHIELQKKLPHSAADSTEPPRADSTTSASTNDSDFRKTDEGRGTSDSKPDVEFDSHLKSASQSRNSQLLDAKAKTLAELREQWDATQSALQSKEAELKERTAALNQAEKTLDTLRLQLVEKESQAEQSTDALAAARERIQRMEEDHKRALEELSASSLSEFDRKLSAEVAKLKEQHADELQQQLSKLNEQHADQLRHHVKEAEQSAEVERDKQLQASHAQREKDLRELEKKLEETHLAVKEEELSRLKELHENDLRAEREKLHKEAEASEALAQELRNAACDSETRRKVLEDQLRSVKEESEQRVKELRDKSEKLEAELRNEIDNVAAEKNDLSRQLELLQETSKRVTEEKSNEVDLSQKEASTLRDECTELRKQLELLQRENDDMRNSPRQVESAAANHVAEQEVLRLNEELSELKATLRIESEKREETTLILEKSDREHDELREMVTRLRHERDAAQLDARQARDELVKEKNPLPPLQHKPSKEQPAVNYQELKEQRDKAIWEVFRMRKRFKSDIARLQKENSSLKSNSSVGSSAETDKSPDGTEKLSEQLSKITSERDRVKADLRKVQADLARVETEHAALGDARERSAQQRLKALEDEILSHKSQVDELEVSLSETRKRSDVKLCEFQEEKDSLVKKIETAETAAAESAHQLEEKNKEIQDLVQKVQSGIETAAETEQNVAALSRERDDVQSRCSVLEAEIVTLKKVIEDLTANSTASESELQLAKKESTDRSAQLSFVQSELEDVRRQALETETHLDNEIIKLKSELSQVSVSAEQHHVRASELQKKMASYRTELEEERAIKERTVLENEKSNSVVKNLMAKVGALTTKISEEHKSRKEAEQKVSELNDKSADLESKLKDLNDKVVEQAAENSQATCEKSELITACDELKHRTSHAEAHSRELEREIKSLREKLTSSESAREILQKEACDAGGESQRVVEELNVLRTELEQARLDLRNAEARLEEEISKAAEEIDKHTAAVGKLHAKNDSLISECSTLQSRANDAERELRQVRKSYVSVKSELDDVARKCSELEDAVREKEAATDSAYEKLSRLQAESSSSRSKFVQLEEDHEQLKLQLDRAKSEIDAAVEERGALSEQVHGMKGELQALQERLRSMHADHERQMASERVNLEREVKRTTDLRRDLRAARSLVESLQSQLERLQMEHEELRKESDRLNNGDEGRDSVLNDLIANRLELAYAQDEIIRLRNKLKKLTPNPSSSTSFEC